MTATIRHQHPGLFKPVQEPEFLRARMARHTTRAQRSWNGKHIFFTGGSPRKGDINLANNDYLSLANHPRVIQAQVDTLYHCGNGAMMSAVFLKEQSAQHSFEQQMAEFLGAEAVVLCQSGWSANVGLIQAIADRDVPVYIDQRAHMSLWEGILSAGAVPRPFRHNNPEHLRRQLRRHGEGIVVVDSVYSTQGDLAPLTDIVAVAEELGGIMVVDESHSLGTHGPHGEGLVAELGLIKRVHFRTASLAKAFVGRAGVIACSRRFADYFPYESRPAIFSSALLPHEIAGLGATLDIVQREDWRRRRLHENAAWLRDAIADLGFGVEVSESQILGLETGSESRLPALRDALEAEGVFGAVFIPPATPKNGALLRLSINCDLSQEHLQRILYACRKAKTVTRPMERLMTQVA